jgi:hypothetical protein
MSKLVHCFNLVSEINPNALDTFKGVKNGDSTANTYDES